MALVPAVDREACAHDDGCTVCATAADGEPLRDGTNADWRTSKAFDTRPAGGSYCGMAQTPREHSKGDRHSAGRRELLRDGTNAEGPKMRGSVSPEEGKARLALGCFGALPGIPVIHRT